MCLVWCIAFSLCKQFYAAKTVIQVKTFDYESISVADNENKLIESLTKLPSMTIDSYMQKVMSLDVLNATIKTLNLRSENGDLLTASDLARSLSYRNPTDTNLIEITCTGIDPLLCAQICNTLALSYIDYLASDIKQQSQQSIDMIATQLAVEEKNLNEATSALANYFKSNKNIVVLNAEIESKINQIVAFEVELNQADKQISADTISLETILAAVQNTAGINPDDFEIILNLENVKSESNQLQMNLGADDLSIALLKIEISKLQNRLISNISLKAALTSQIKIINESLATAQIQLTENKYKYNELNGNQIIAEQTYNSYLQKHNEALLIVSSDIGKNSVIVTTAAIEPNEPISANKFMYIIFAALLGLIFGILIVLFREFWKRSKKT